jgi:NAD(P)H-nitrite reductase large subunit
MTTPGLVSITVGGIVQYKAVCSCNGLAFGDLAERIRRGACCTAHEVFEAAQEVGFGCSKCLVVIGPNIVVRAKECPETPPRYLTTFEHPGYHPGIQDATISCAAIVALDFSENEMWHEIENQVGE